MYRLWAAIDMNVPALYQNLYLYYTILLFS